MRRLAIFALPLMLIACGDVSDEGDGGADAAGAGAIAPMENAVLDLQGTGIVVPAQGGYEELAVPFGSNRAPTEATLANIVGSATSETDTPNDCGLTVTQYQGLMLSFRGDEFVGYTAEAPYIPETPRAEFLAAGGVAMVEDSTLGEEFTLGDPIVPNINGIFDGDGDEAAISMLWAGENCIAR